MTVTQFSHVSVLPEEVLSMLAPRPGGVYADVTLGGGGHAGLILEACAPNGRLLGLDRDLSALEAAKTHLSSERVTFRHALFSEVGEVLTEEGFPLLDGLLADIGVSSPQVDHAERGFSFAQEGPLDMRMDPSCGQTAGALIHALEEDALANVIYQLGEERRSRAIAKSIKRACDAGKMATTRDLRRAVVRVLGPKRGRMDPATRTFQALRIAVNGELDQLGVLLKVLPDVLADEGIAVVISFHSLEDRMVKHTFRDDARWQVLTKKPMVAGPEECAVNRRARTAKLRAVRRMPRSMDHANDTQRKAYKRAAYQSRPRRLS